MHEKLDDLRTTDRSWKQSEVEVPPGHARHRRQRLPVKVILQHRRLSAWRPGTAAVRALAQSALVDEDDGAPLFAGFFFNLRPTLLLPQPDLFFVPLQRPPHWTLAAPAQLPQNAPGLRGMVADSAFLFDQMGHAPRGPQTGFVAQSLRPTLQPALDTPQIFRTQTRSAPSPSRFLQGALSAPLELLRPAAH